MKHVTIDAEEEDKGEQKSGTKDARLVNMNQVTKLPKGTFQKKLNEKLNVIQCAIFVRGETNMAVSFAVLTVNIFFMTYVCSDTTRISFPQQ
jgi:hypothetical protein